MKTAQELPEILTARDISEYLDIGYNKALRFIRFSGLPYLKITNTYRVPRDKFLAWVFNDEVKELTL